MSRRRYRWDTATQTMVEVGAEWNDTPRSTGDLSKFEYDNLQATDGTDISSRTKRREYMKAHGVTDPSDFRETWAKAQVERDSYRRGEKVNPETRQAIGRIAYELERKKR